MFLIVEDRTGQRVYRLSPQGPDQPVIVGSAPGSAIHMPFEEVSERHCGLFTSGGHWFVRDEGSATGTFVNGMQARYSTPIIEGDTISLGEYDGAPTLVLSVNKPPPKPRLSKDLANLSEAAAADEHWFKSGVQSAPTPSSGAGVRRQGMSPEAMLAGALVMLVIGAIGAFLIYRLNVSKQAPIVMTTGPAIASPATTAPIKVIVRPSTRATKASAGATTMPKPPVDPHAGDDDWKRVADAHRMATPAIAILAYDDYVSRHPHTEWQNDLNAYTDEALDRVWWQRLKEIIERQADLQKQIKPLEAHLKELNLAAPDPLRKQELSDQIDGLKKQSSELENGQFVQMKYTRAEAPDVYNSELLDTMRKERDPAAYAQWKQKVLTSIRRTRGSLPW